MTLDHVNDQSLVLVNRTKTGVLRITLNNPSRRNALSETMLYHLHQAVTAAAVDPLVRVLVLAANGPVFCAGHDLKELTQGRSHSDNGRAYFEKIMLMCSQLMQGIMNCSKPVIAEVSGVATAAGCQLVASCDLAYAQEEVVFSTPGVNIGLFCSTPMVALSRNVASKHALEMLLTGDFISAHRAAEMGLINGVTTESDLTSKTMEIAMKIAAKSSDTVAIGKRAFYEQREMALSDAYVFGAKVMVENILTQDAEEGINSFIEKRAATWSDQ